MKNYRVETKSGSFLGIIEGKRAFNKWFEDRQKFNTYVKKEDCILIPVKESKKACHVIYDSYDIYNEENMKAEKENFIENGFSEEEITQDMLFSALCDSNRFWFDDAHSILAECSEGKVIAIADIGRWNGRVSGYKEIKDLADIMYSDCDYEKIYVDGNGDMRKEESHHDGSNSILYRYWKHGLTQTQKDNFLDKIYSGKATSKDVTRYTRKAGLDIADYFGWKVKRA